MVEVRDEFWRDVALEIWPSLHNHLDEGSDDLVSCCGTSDLCLVAIATAIMDKDEMRTTTRYHALLLICMCV